MTRDKRNRITSCGKRLFKKAPSFRDKYSETTGTTEFKYSETNANGKLIIKKTYLDPFLDMFNSEILSYRLSERPNAKVIMDALDEAIEIAKGCTYRTTLLSNQGWAYQMKSYVKKLKNNGIFQSMSRKRKLSG
ncbi:transposase [Paenisporosarcina antarctica]|uniref:Transposase n=1 Tax=Paenisporosarcina antarctica TaxID=417367 RepID=A0A4P7A419_9BACL|nr:transposase [Paenisporosarcina antarctica]